MPITFSPENIFVAVLIASGGLWWFRKILPNIGKSSKVTQLAIYAAIWFAYFFAVMLVIEQAGG